MVRDEFNFGAKALVKVGVNGVMAVQKIKIMSMAESYGHRFSEIGGSLFLFKM